MADLDQRIIECLVAGDVEQLQALWRDGGGEAAVRARAKEIGLTEEFIKNCRLSGSSPKLRPCIKCDGTFLSRGKSNRLCRRCGSK